MRYTSNGIEFYGVPVNDSQRPDNILVTDASGKRKCFVTARYKYTDKAEIILEDGHNFKPSDCDGPLITTAIEALQLVYGPGLPVHNNLERAGHLAPYTPPPSFAHGPIAGCLAVYGEEFAQRIGLITTREASTIIGVTIRRVQALIKSGKLPAERIGRDWMIRRADAEKHQPERGGRPKREAGPQGI